MKKTEILHIGIICAIIFLERNNVTVELKTPPGEIELARKYKADYERRNTK